MDEEYVIKMKVLPAKGITYHRLQLEIELPEAFKEWGIVPAFLYGSEASMYAGRLVVNIRKPKQGGK
jgi:hypothetical protein